MTGGWEAILAAGIEHDSVLAPARRWAGRMLELAVDTGGVVAIQAVADRVAEARVTGTAGAPRLLSLQLANNETGVVQPVAAAAEAARSQGLMVHTDAVQAAGRVAVSFTALGVDYLSLSAHKLGGPKGVGALVIRDGADLPAFIAGGGQERRRRAGTENVPAIAGFGAAARAAARDLTTIDGVRALRDRVEAEARAIAPSAVVIGAEAERLPNTACIALPGASAETLVIALDLAGVAVSAGAACSSGKVGASHVLAAMGLDPALARSAIRVSLGWGSTEADVDAFASAWAHVAARRRAVA
jgi:cysteine desulfurase